MSDGNGSSGHESASRGLTIGPTTGITISALVLILGTVGAGYGMYSGVMSSIGAIETEQVRQGEVTASMKESIARIELDIRGNATKAYVDSKVTTEVAALRAAMREDLLEFRSDYDAHLAVPHASAAKTIETLTREIDELRMELLKLKK